MRDQCPFVKGALGNGRNVVAVKRQDPQVCQACKRLLLHALDLVVAHNQSGEAAQIGKHVGRQDGQDVVAHVPAKEGMSNGNSVL